MSREDFLQMGDEDLNLSDDDEMGLGLKPPSSQNTGLKRGRKKRRYEREEEEEEEEEEEAPARAPAQPTPPRVDAAQLAVALMGAHRVARQINNRYARHVDPQRRSQLAAVAMDARTDTERLAWYIGFIEHAIEQAMDTQFDDGLGDYLRANVSNLWEVVRLRREAQLQQVKTPSQEQQTFEDVEDNFAEQLTPGMLGQTPLMGSQDSLFLGDVQLDQWQGYGDGNYGFDNAALPLPEGLEWAEEHQHAVHLRKLSGCGACGHGQTLESLAETCLEYQPGRYASVKFHDEAGVDREAALRLWAKMRMDLPGVTFEQFVRGLVVETEHGLRPGLESTNVTHNVLELTARIAAVHLKESPYYYELLELVEVGEGLPGSRPCEDSGRIHGGVQALLAPLRMYLMLCQRGGKTARRAAFARDVMTAIMAAKEEEMDTMHATVRDMIEMLRQMEATLEE